MWTGWRPFLIPFTPLPLFFAQGDGAPTTVVGALIFGFCALMALTVWVVKSLMDKTVPELSKTFAATVESIRAELAAQRGVFETRQDALLTFVNTAVRSERDAGDRRAGEERAAGERRAGELLAAFTKARLEELGQMKTMQEAILSNEESLRGLADVIRDELGPRHPRIERPVVKGGGA